MLPECNNRGLPICCYDFHHNKGVKKEDIGKMIGRKRSLDNELKNELQKCIVVCANCHRMITYNYVDNKTLQSLFHQ